jgi:hypothetical protein
MICNPAPQVRLRGVFPKVWLDVSNLALIVWVEPSLKSLGVAMLKPCIPLLPR